MAADELQRFRQQLTGPGEDLLLGAAGVRDHRAGPRQQGELAKQQLGCPHRDADDDQPTRNAVAQAFSAAAAFA